VDVGADLVAARQAIGDRAWAEALDRFVAADAAGTLSVEDLVAMSDAAFWAGRSSAAMDALQRAHRAFEGEERFGEAAEVALTTARMYAMQGDLAAGSGWIERARRRLAELAECAGHAHLAYIETYICLLFKDYEQAAEGARRVEAIARRVGDRERVVLARSLQGTIAVHTGDTVGGMRLLDEALATATAGELGIFGSAEVLCEMVVSSLAVADYERAAEWLDIAEGSDRIISFPGCCRVHRSTMLRHQGKWDEARSSATQARTEVAGLEATHEGIVLTEIGELHLGKGELALAERAFTQSYEKGWFPQPGLALVVLAKHDADGAARMIARAVEASAQELASLVWLLPAQAEIAIAAGDAGSVEAAGNKLREVASVLGTSAALAASACVNGLFLQQRGDLTGAAREFELGVRTWQQARNPYEAARARLRLATVLEALGDASSATLELTAAQGTFEKLGATPAATEAARRLGEDQPAHATRTFMFTDIVDSTQLLMTVGDDAWHGIHRWHDRTATAIFSEHHGTIVKDTGDGFFVTFADVRMAVGSAVALQRALEAHRRTDGFSPAVRIGLHVGSAVLVDADYRGRDVNIAARIGAVAGPHEILISRDVADQLGNQVPVGERRHQSLKGIPEPVELAVVDWR